MSTLTATFQMVRKVAIPAMAAMRMSTGMIGTQAVSRSTSSRRQFLPTSPTTLVRLKNLSSHFPADTLAALYGNGDGTYIIRDTADNQDGICSFVENRQVLDCGTAFGLYLGLEALNCKSLLYCICQRSI
jgi:hypothetical protein